MALISRRNAGKLLLAGCAGALAPARELLSAAKINSVVRGVQLGAQAYSFRDLPLDETIAAFRAVGLGECELTEIQFSKPYTHGTDVNQWRLDAPMSFFKEARKKFDDAGVSLSANGYIFRPELTDEMIERGFLMTQALGLDCMTTSTGGPFSLSCEANPRPMTTCVPTESKYSGVPFTQEAPLLMSGSP